MKLKAKPIKRRMTDKRRALLEKGVANVVNRLSIEGIYGLPDYEIANRMINLFIADVKKQKKLGELK